MKHLFSTVINNGQIILSVLVLYLGLMTLGACQIEEDIPPDLAPQEPTPPETLSIEVVGLEAPNRYQAILNWQTNSEPKAWLIHRQEKSEATPTLIATLDKKLRTFVDANVAAGKAYTYFVFGETDAPLKTEVIVPTDLDVTGTITLRGDLKFNRIFFRDGSRVVTNGETLNLTAAEIISDGGMIDSSPPSRIAPPGTSGLGAGAITINAKSAHGTLKISGKGENGTNGIDGQNGRDGRQGPTGKAGECGINPEYARRILGIESAESAMRRNPLPSNNDLLNFLLFGTNICKFICVRAPENGGPGERGADGNDGGAGGAGGDSAKVFVHIEESSNFVVSIDTTPGIGGAGGRGGRGGKGGPGGLPGARDQDHRCPPANPGPPGEDGRPGRTGRYGADGLRQPTCIWIGNELSADCSQFREEMSK